MANRNDVVSIVLPRRFHKALNAIAGKQDRSRSATVRMMIAKTAHALDIPIDSADEDECEELEELVPA